MSKLQKKPSALKREHPALKTWNFLIFSTIVVIFALLDKDTEYGSMDLIESGSGDLF